MNNSSVFIISAPSGSGKTTLVERLLQEVPGLHFSVSYTTRAPRGPEQHNREYCFVSREEFREMIAQNRLLEWAEVFGNYYGTATRFLDEARQAGEDLLLDIDVQGAAQVKKVIPDAVSVFILPPSRMELEARLRRRSQDQEDVIQKRLRDATREIQGYGSYDFILVNDDLEQSAERLKAIVTSERLRRSGAQSNESAPLAESCRKENVLSQIQPILASFGGS
ncbi:MAG: guanylate kinase [Acidobacteria bacterium RIFCSPLOWO2_12_FULL_54_10]|nr:MAG: guanylate kinase [Acidobacteria bacterium RIFCSPLOWO2_12_FULL_54_10]